MNRGLAYIQFFFQSLHLHGIHSPFVYQLEQQCLKAKQPYEAYKAIAAYRQTLKQDSQVLEIQDFGAGSRVAKTNKRAVKDLLKQSASTKKRSALLYRLAHYFKACHILELGTNLGVGTQALAQYPQAQITSMEGCPHLFQYASSQLKALAHVRLIHSNFTAGLAQLAHQKWDLIFMDGHHEKDATLEYFETLLPQTHEGSVIIVDDINWSEGMQKAWEAIKAHPKVRITVDTFFWGLVFFREGQAKEHFKIRV